MGCKSAFVPTVRDEVKAAVERAIEAVVRRVREVCVPGGQAARSPAVPPRRRWFLRRPFSEPRRLAPEVLEPRLLFATVTWTNASGGDWNTASNWDTGSLPGSTDDVVISVAGTPTITHGSGSHTVHSITSDEPFTISGGTLTVTSTVQVNNTFTLNGGTLAGATVNAGSGGQGLTVTSQTANRLSGVTMAAGIDLTASAAFLRVKDGMTLNGTATLGGTSNPKILLENTETVSGSGSIHFPSSGSAYLLVEGGATATLGSGITVHGGAGSIGDYYVSDTARTLINQGTISADVSGQTLNVISTNLAFTNQGTAEAKAGATLAINRTNISTFTPSNSGTLRADGSNATLRLGGTWAAGAVGTLSSVNGGSVYFGSQGNGTINNAGSTISLGNTSGSWVLDGATVSGGTLAIASGKSLTVTASSNNRLSGITVNGDLDLTASAAFVRFKDGVALNGTATLGGTSSPKILLENTETVSGTGTIVFPSSGGAELRVESSAAVTLGSGITVRGGAGFIGDSSSVFNSVARSLVNQGTISADVSGQRIFINTENFTFTNQGVVEAKSGGAVYLNTSAYSTLTPSNSGTLRADGSGSAMRLGGTWASGALGTLSAVNSGSVYLGYQGTGTINNAGSTISLGNTGGSWVLQGATIVGGTLNVASGASLTVTGFDANRLSGTTVNGNVDMTASGAFLRVKDGLTLNGAVTLGSTSSPKLLFENTLTVSGSGTIALPNTDSAEVRVEGGASVTLGSGITVRGSGRLGNSSDVNNAVARTLINQGTISADAAGQPIYVNAANLTFVNQGTAEAKSGATLGINVNNYSSMTPSNSGTLKSDGANSALRLGGTWASGSLGNLAATGGGKVCFGYQGAGTINNAGNTITLGNTGGSWILEGATITGGTLNVSSGASLVASGYTNNRLSNVTLNGGVDLTAPGAFLRIKDGLTLNGTATLGGTAVSGSGIPYPAILLENTQSVGGTGIFAFPSSGSPGLMVEGGASVTVGSGIQIRGGAGNIGSPYSNTSARTLVNQGTILGEVAAQSLSVSAASLSFTNSGTVKAAGGGAVTVGSSSFTNDGLVVAEASSITINPTSFANHGTIEAKGTGTVNIQGSLVSGYATGMSGTEVAFRVTGLDGTAGATYDASVSTDGVNFGSPSPIKAGSSSTNFLGGLDPSTPYTTQAGVTNPDGSKILYVGDPASTTDEPEQQGTYKVVKIVGPMGVELTSYHRTDLPGTEMDYDWDLGTGEATGGSIQSALAKVFDGLVKLERGPAAPQSDGSYMLYHRRWDGLLDPPHDLWSFTPFEPHYAATPVAYTITLATVNGQADPAKNGGPGGEDENGTGGDPGEKSKSQDPVRYFDGSVVYDTTDLQSDGFGQPWGQSRSWTNLTQFQTSGRNGTGMVNTNLPSIRRLGDSTFEVVNRGTDVRTFKVSGTSYVADSFIKNTLTHPSGEFVYTDTLGNVTRFYDFTSSYPSKQRGQFKSFTDAGGNVTYVSAQTGDGDVAEVRRRNAAGVDAESWLYSYLPTGDANAGLLQSVRLRQPDGAGGWSAVRRVDYAYYDGAAPYGKKHDLKTATIKDASGGVIDTNYYRYYTTGEAHGFTHGLKYVFDQGSYARLAAAVADPLAAADAVVAAFATHYFEYDAEHRATKHAIQGSGGTTSGGIGTFTYAYSSSNNAEGTNSWKYKTVETLPDGNQNVVYCNSDGAIMLKAFKDLSDAGDPSLSGKQWLTFYKYDSAGRIVLEAGPSAVTGYDETKADLLNSQGGNYQYLSDTDGLIHLTDYYASTTATETSAGSAAGYVQQEKVARGELGTPVLQSSKQYFARTGGTGAGYVYPEAIVTAYRNGDGTGAQVTTYGYTWYDGSNQMKSVTTANPVVGADQNGPAAADVTVLQFDRYGRLTWSKDGDGYINYTAYDDATGAAVKSIRDVDTSLTSDFTDLPAGWATPAGGGLRLTASFEVDALGRTTKSTDANGNVTYTVYNDATHEIRTYRGWNAATNTPTGPTEVVRIDRSRGYTETVTMSAVPGVTGGRPNGAEAIAGVQSLVREYVNAAAQVAYRDEYFDLGGLTYSAGVPLGVQGTNYYRTAYAYDAIGNKARTLSATGTIYRTAFDALARAASTWVGTNDTPASGAWSPANNTGASNMFAVSEHQYDGGNAGDGNLTRVTRHPGGGAADRVSQMFYDWRDRPVATKEGAQGTEAADSNRPITYVDYDNLGHAVATYRYDGDGVSIADANADGVPDKPSSGLRAKSTAAFDELGRVFESTAYFVDQATGAVLADPLVTRYWYDHRGNLIKSAAPGGLVTKHRYDGSGRVAAVYSTDGGADSLWADASTLSGDVVYTQVETAYDDNGNVILTTTRDRFGDELVTATGALADGSTSPKARVTYVASYYDAANRLVATANVGTNSGTAYTRPSSVPARSDAVLVSSVTYDAAGRSDTVTDPRGIVTKTVYDALGRATAVIAAYTDGVPTDSSNRTTTFTYDGAGHVLTQTAVQPAGRVSQTTQTLYGVTGPIFSNDLIAAVKLPDPATGLASNTNQQTYAYNALGEVVSRTEPNGAVRGYSYDVLGRVRTDTVTTTDDSGSPSIQSRYDTAGNLTSQTDPRGYTTDYEYDALGRRTRLLLPSPDGVAARPTTTFAYDAAGNLASVTDPRGGVTTYQYDLLGRRTQQVEPDPDGAGPLTSPTTTYRYSVGGDSNTSVDPRGNLAGATAAHHTVTEVVDAFGRRIQVIQPSPDGVASQPTTAYTYDRNGNVTSTTDPRGNTTTYVLDNFDRVVQMTAPDPDGAGPLAAPVTAYAYDALGSLVQVTDSLNHVTDYQYDALNRRTAELLPPPASGGSRPTTTFAYDLSGNLVSVTDPVGAQTTHAYNQLNRLTSTTEPDPDGAGSLTSPVTEFDYDFAGNLVQVTDALSGVTSYEYDRINRKTSQTLPDPDGAGSLTGPVTTYAYDASGNLTSTTDPLGETATYAYDALNRQTSQTLPDPDGAGSLTAPVTAYTYDASGNLLSITDPASNTTTYTYDNLNRQSTDTNQLGGTRSSQYDAAGNLVKATDRNGRVREFEYDNLNRMTAEYWRQTAGSAVIRTITFAYDAKGRLTSVSDPDSAYANAYDDLDRVVTIDNNGTPNMPRVVLSLTYDAKGRRTGVSSTVAGSADFANAYAYDALDRLTRVTQTGTGVAAKRVDFSYTAVGRFEQIKRYNDAAGTSAAAVSTYAYDDAHRLTGLTHKQGTTTLVDYAWAFDAASRITSFTSPDGTATYAYDANGQLLGTDNSTLADESYTYDANGNRTMGGYTTGSDNRLTSDGTYDYEYDAEGNRTRRTDIATGEVVEYGWDHRNRLTDVTFRSSLGGTVTNEVKYVYDANDLRIGKLEHLLTPGVYQYVEWYALDGEDVALVFTAGVVSHRYLHGAGVDQVLAEEPAGGGVRWFLGDDQGSVRDIVDGSGTALDHVLYDTFGSVLSRTATFSLRYGYTGRELDGETELYYSRARYYDPGSGRFLSTDPQSFAAGDSNLYRYVGNSSPNWRDPSGLEADQNAPTEWSDEPGGGNGEPGEPTDNPDYEQKRYEEYLRDQQQNGDTGQQPEEDPDEEEERQALRDEMRSELAGLLQKGTALTPSEALRLGTLVNRLENDYGEGHALERQMLETYWKTLDANSQEAGKKYEGLRGIFNTAEQYYTDAANQLDANADATTSPFLAGLEAGTGQFLRTFGGLLNVPKMRDNRIAESQLYQDEYGLTASQAWGLSSVRYVPVLNAVEAGLEIYWGKSISAFDAGRTLGGEDIAQRALLITGEAAGVAAGGVRASGSTPRIIGEVSGASAEPGAIVQQTRPAIAPEAAGATPRVVNEETIRAALQGADLKTAQGAVSIPAVERYVRMLEAGSPAPPIKVAGNVIVDGNHRYIAGRIFGQEPQRIPGTLSPSQTPRVQPIQNIRTDPIDWGNN